MKTFRFIGMALLAIVMCVNFASCSDDEEEQGETYSIEGTWLLQSSKGYIENSNDKNTWDESYPDLQETKLEITKNSNGKYTFKEYYFQDGSSSWENAPFTYYPTLSGTTLTVTPHIMDCWDTAKIKSLDKTKLVLECVGDDGNENWYSVTIKILDAEADDGFTIYQNGTGDDNILVQYDSQYNNQSDYANFVSGTESAYAVKDETVYTNLSEAGLNMEDQADDDDNSTEYNLQITADNTTVEAGDTVSLTAVLKKGQTEITDLEAAGLHLYWWNNTTNSSGEFINYDESNGYSLTLQTTLGTLGTNEIQAKLQDAEWKDIVIKKIEITVNEASNSVKDAPIDMFSIVIVGNSNTYVRDGKMITPRGYEDKYGFANVE